MPENQSAEPKQRPRQSTIAGSAFPLVLAPLGFLLFLSMLAVAGVVIVGGFVVRQLWHAFRDLKHGKPEKLHDVERRFFEYIGAAS
jgi:hypothetical protein